MNEEPSYDGQEQSDIPEGSPRFVEHALEGLVPKFAKGGVIVYVGAGVSHSARLPSWDELLDGLQNEARGRLANEGPVARKYFDRLKEKSRNLEIGDWLLGLLGPDFQNHIRSKFSGYDGLKERQPSKIHLNLVRLPFRMAVTTNYDLLLKKAYERAFRVDPERPEPLTWTEIGDVIKAVNEDSFRIVHAHGIVGRDSTLILSGSQYSKSQEAKPNFGEVLKWLFKTKTFLFIGAGLEDPDLIFQLQQAKSEHGTNVGPHYALLPFREAPERRRNILLKTLNIKVVPVGNEELEHLEPKDWITNSIARALRDLSGRVAFCHLDPSIPGVPTSDHASFCRNPSLVELLKHAIDVSGSYRGDICLPPDGSGQLSGKLVYELVEGPTDGGVQGSKVEHNSICGIAFYQGSAEHGVYVDNTEKEHISKSSQLGHFGKIAYVTGDKEVRSELAMPIEADGVRIGVLNLESNLEDAYNPYHILVARRFADKVGRLCAAAHERQRRGERLDAKEIDLERYREIRKICERLWRLVENPGNSRGPAKMELALLLYRADYISGKLIAHDPNSTILAGLGLKEVAVPVFDFYEKSNTKKYLATRVFLNGRPYFYPDAGAAIKLGKLTVAFQDELRLTGHVAGFPILIDGHIAGVVTLWDRSSDEVQIDGRHIELFRRAFHLMANAFHVAEAPGSGDKERSLLIGNPKDVLAVERAERVIDCITAPGPEVDKAKPNRLNEVGDRFYDALGGVLRQFLTALHRQDADFIETMTQFERSSPKPSSWITPRRARCWVRITPSEEPQAKPRFLLGLQISVDSNDSTSNTYSRNGSTFGIVMQPFVRLESGGQANTSKKQNPYKYLPGIGPTTEIRLDGYRPFESLVYDDNPHLSFLLSRISAYPFAFQQRPKIVGNDVMWRVLEKDPRLPWLVAPLIREREQRWKEVGPLTEGGLLEDDSLVSESCLVAYLTFDNGRYVTADPHVNIPDLIDPVELTGQWALFRNDLLHQIALFGACLAHNHSFDNLVQSSKSQASLG